MTPRSNSNRPEIVKDEHLEYLDGLRESGVTNMWGAGAYLRDDFPELNRDETRQITKYWMKTFGEATR